jgi:pilus assembly protein CpaF
MDSSTAVARPKYLRSPGDIVIWDIMEQAVQEVRRAVLELPIGGANGSDFDDLIRNTLIPRALAHAERELPPAIQMPPNAGQVLFSLMRGYAELDPLLLDPQVTEVIVDGPDQEVYVERHGMLEGTGMSLSRDRIMRLAERMGGEQGQLISTAHPVQEIRLPMARVTAIHERLAPKGPSLVIRLRGRHHLELDDLLANGTIPRPIWEAVSGAFNGGANILVSGDVSSGKTTLAEVLLATLPADRRIVTVEDPIEFDLPRKRLQQLEVRTPNVGANEFNQRELIRLSLRMRPDHLIVGEVRDGAAWDMVDAMTLGHNGSLATIHGATVIKSMIRLENLAMRAEDVPSLPAVRRAIREAVNLVVQISRLPDTLDGAPIIRRVVTEIAELTDLPPENDSANPYHLTTLAALEGGVLTLTGKPLSDGLAARLRAAGIEPGFA